MPQTSLRVPSLSTIQHITMSSPGTNKTYSRTAEYRKKCKPIVERKRRARMNKSLNELKAIMLDVVKKDGCQYSKLEKADILEMTVKHLHQLRRSPQSSSPAITTPTPGESIEKFRVGFVQCTAEVSRFMGQVDSSHTGSTCARLLNHLKGCITQLEQFPMPSPQGQYPLGVTQTAGQQPLRVYTPPISPGYGPISPISVTPDLIKREMTSPLALTVSTRTLVQPKTSPWRPW